MTTAKSDKTVTCPKCNGSGKLVHFIHIDNGRCFMCAGAGTIEVSDLPAPRRSRRDPAQTRQHYINVFRGALRRLHEEGMSWLDELVDPYMARTEREQLGLCLSSPDCPEDVRFRAKNAFDKAHVKF